MSDSFETDPYDRERDGDGDGAPHAPESILCVDCGGTCHLLTRPFVEENGSVGFQVGDVVAYRCEECLDRWDIVLE